MCAEQTDFYSTFLRLATLAQGDFMSNCSYAAREAVAIIYLNLS